MRSSTVNGLFTGIALATYRVAAERVQREATARQVAIEGLLMDFACRDLSPGWLVRLTDNSRYFQVKLDSGVFVPIGWRVIEIKIRDLIDTQSFTRPETENQ